jgi:dTDP-4-dehydrorhamnose reductase
LLYDILKRIIRKSNRLTLLDEVTDAKDLPNVIESSDPEWVIVSLKYDHVIPAWVDAYTVNHPSACFLAIAADGSKIKMK